MFRLWLKALVVALFTAGVFAQQQEKNVPASTFYLEQTETQFSISLANNSSDVYIYFTSPAYSWVGVGFGESMKNSLMLIMYPNAKGDNVTVSPRLSTGHSEPSFAPGIQLDILNGTGFSDEMFVLKAVCRTCRVWSGGFLDASSSAQHMIFAFGPGLSLQSNDLNAPLKRHVRYGRFTMDMAAATSADASVPNPETQLRGVTMGGLVKDHDRKNLAHAIVGCLALFVLWPLNVILAGFFRNIKIHIGMSVAILCFLVIAYGLGISTSFEYNRAKGFSSPHQIFAFIALLPVLLLSLLPIRAISSLKPWIPRLHTPLTNVTFIILVLTGGLGLRLASATNPITLVYVAIALVVFIFITLVTLCVRRRGSAYARATTRRRLGEEDSRDFGLAKWGARKKVEEEAESGHWYPAPQGHARSASAASNASGKAMFGGGTMPGPQYLMNMHPGVPVYVK